MIGTQLADSFGGSLLRLQVRVAEVLGVNLEARYGDAKHGYRAFLPAAFSCALIPCALLVSCMKKLLIVGGTGILARQAAEIAALMGLVPRFVSPLNESVRAPLETDEDFTVFVALDEADERFQLINALPEQRLVNLIHPTASVSTSAQLAHGIMIGANAIVGMDATIGAGVVQNALAAIEHDNRIGAFTFLGTGAILCGHVATEEFAFVGAGATVQPGTRIGRRTTIGSGAVLVKDADADAVYVGNPARKLGS